MAEQNSKNDAKAKAPERTDRLKAALKANMAKRKAQARARSQEQPGDNKTKG